MIFGLQPGLVNAAVVEAELHLISGTPVVDSDLRFPFDLSVVRKGTVIPVVNLVPPSSAYFIGFYLDKRVVILGYYDVSFAKRFSMIDMNYPFRTHSFPANVDPENECVEYVHVLDLLNRGLFVGYDLRCKETPDQYVGLDLNTGLTTRLNPDDYRYVIVGGYSGAQSIYGDAQVVQILADGRVVRKLGGGVITDMGWVLPKELRPEQERTGAVYVRNKQVVTLSLPDDLKESSEAKPEVRRFAVWTARDGKWHLLHLEGTFTQVRGFGRWLSGYVAYAGRGEPSPGVEVRRKDMTRTGTPFDWRVDHQRHYLPGILFVYDTQRRKLYRHVTGQGDSEVLLVEGEYMYYRVNDRIYRAAIGEEHLGMPELVVEGEVVPDIHWAFFGPSPPPPGGSPR